MADKRALVVGGSDLFSASLAQWLERCGARARVAADGATALEMMAGERPDLVVFDPVLPVPGAAQLLAAMDTDPRLRAVCLVVVSRPRRGPGKLGREAFHIRLPLDPREVEQVIQGLVDGCGEGVGEGAAVPDESGASRPPAERSWLRRPAAAWRTLKGYVRLRRSPAAGGAMAAHLGGRGAGGGQARLATARCDQALQAVTADRQVQNEWGSDEREAGARGRGPQADSVPVAAGGGALRGSRQHRF